MNNSGYDPVLECGNISRHIQLKGSRRHDSTSQVCQPYDDVKRSFQTALKRSGIVDFRFHDLRHTFASHLVMAGVDVTTVKERLGHKTLTMTLRYAHLAPAHKVKAVDLLDSALNSKPTIQKLYNPKEKGLTCVG